MEEEAGGAAEEGVRGEVHAEGEEDVEEEDGDPGVGQGVLQLGRHPEGGEADGVDEDGGAEADDGHQGAAVDGRVAGAGQHADTWRDKKLN